MVLPYKNIILCRNWRCYKIHKSTVNSDRYVFRQCYCWLVLVSNISPVDHVVLVSLVQISIWIPYFFFFGDCLLEWEWIPSRFPQMIKWWYPLHDVVRSVWRLPKYWKKLNTRKIGVGTEAKIHVLRKDFRCGHAKINSGLAIFQKKIFCIKNWPGPFLISTLRIWNSRQKILRRQDWPMKFPVL